MAHGGLSGSGQHLILWESSPGPAHLEQGIALYDPQQHRPYSLRRGHDPGFSGLTYVAWALWYLGYPDQALKSIHEALTLAQELAHPFSLAYALNLAAWLHQLRRELLRPRSGQRPLIALSSEQGFPHWLARNLLRGWALAEQGQGEEGITQIRQGLAAYRAREQGLRPIFLPCWPRRIGKQDRRRKGSPCWPRHWL